MEKNHTLVTKIRDLLAQPQTNMMTIIMKTIIQLNLESHLVQ